MTVGDFFVASKGVCVALAANQLIISYLVLSIFQFNSMRVNMESSYAQHEKLWNGIKEHFIKARCIQIAKGCFTKWQSWIPFQELKCEELEFLTSFFYANKKEIISILSDLAKMPRLSSLMFAKSDYHVLKRAILKREPSLCPKITKFGALASPVYFEDVFKDFPGLRELKFMLVSTSDLDMQALTNSIESYGVKNIQDLTIRTRVRLDSILPVLGKTWPNLKHLTILPAESLDDDFEDEEDEEAETDGLPMLSILSSLEALPNLRELSLEVESKIDWDFLKENRQSFSHPLQSFSSTYEMNMSDLKVLVSYCPSLKTLHLGHLDLKCSKKTPDQDDESGQGEEKASKAEGDDEDDKEEIALQEEEEEEDTDEEQGTEEEKASKAEEDPEGNDEEEIVAEEEEEGDAEDEEDEDGEQISDMEEDDEEGIEEKEGYGDCLDEMKEDEDCGESNSNPEIEGQDLQLYSPVPIARIKHLKVYEFTAYRHVDFTEFVDQFLAKVKTINLKMCGKGKHASVAGLALNYIVDNCPRLEELIICNNIPANLIFTAPDIKARALSSSNSDPILPKQHKIPAYSKYFKWPSLR